MIENTIYLDEKYSTTKLLTREKPEIVNNSEDKFESVLFLSEGKERKSEGGLRTKGYYKKSYEDKPLISIITVVYNGEKYLEETILSVINQTYDNVEYIIIDGGSTDGTIDIIKKYNDKIDYWVSEKDDGIYDGMNKGIKLCMGDIIGLINADDWYEKDTISLVIEKYLENNDYDIFHGNINYIDKSQKKYKPKFTYTNMLYKGMSLYHPTCFVKKSLYNDELFDSNYKLVADYKFIFSMMLKEKNFYYIDKVLANMRAGGAGTAFWKRIVEGHKIRNDLGFIKFLVYVTSFYRISITLASKLKKMLKI
jgi:glycosyltransferase involved in cell wall biosynthesis